MEHATQLRVLNLILNEISDLTPLEGLTQLRELTLLGNKIRDIKPLARLTNLTQLWLATNEIRNVSPLKGLTQLTELRLNDNEIQNIRPLAGLVNLEILYLNGNQINNVSPLAGLTNLRKVILEKATGEVEIGFPLAGPKIEGPWLWMIVATGRKSGGAAASSGKDYLAVASRGAVTEQQIATNGATAGERVKNRVWTWGKLAPTGDDNITEVVRAIGLVRSRDIDNHVAYGSISLRSPQKQKTEMYVGSDEAVKVWLNGKLVHEYLDDRSASDYQESFPVTLKKGKNVLLVAVYERTGYWSGFFGFENDATYSLIDIPDDAVPEPVFPSAVQVGPTQRPPMYWIDAKTGTLHRLVGAKVENLVPSVQNATSLTVDMTSSTLFWTEQTSKRSGKIRRANLDGTNVQVLATLKSVPHSIVVDPVRGKLYWTNSLGRIQRSKLNGKQIRTLVRNLDSPENITVDVARAKLYWTEASGRIQRANLNGKSVENIVSNLGTLSGIAISGNKIYYGTTITGESRGSIGRANLNGSNLRPIVTLRSVLSGIAIDPVGNKLYWTESDGYMRRANLNGKKIQNVVSGLTSPAHLVLESSGATTAAPPAKSPLASSEAPTPEATHLLANYPNPFNPETWIPYQLATDSDVMITIYDVRGTLVRQLDLGHQPVGLYQSQNRAAYWDGRNAFGEPVASGVYFYTLFAGEFTATRKMLIRK